MPDAFPFDRPHWTIDIDFPMIQIGQRNSLFDEVRRVASQFGGSEAGSSEPAKEFAGRPGYTTFGIAVAFEEGDVNADTFIRRVSCHFADLGIDGVKVEFDPAVVVYPGEDDASFPFH